MCHFFVKLDFLQDRFSYASVKIWLAGLTRLLKYARKLKIFITKMRNTGGTVRKIRLNLWRIFVVMEIDFHTKVIH